MDLYEPTLLLCLLCATREVQGIFFAKPFSRIGDMGYRMAHSIIPGRIPDFRSGRPMLIKRPDSLLEYESSDLLGLDRLIPHSGEWESKATHDVVKLSPKVETIHRDDQTLIKWTKGHDGRHIDTPQNVLHGLYEENYDNDEDLSHRILHEAQSEMRDKIPEEKEIGNEYPLAEEMVIEKEADSAENRKKTGIINLRLVGIDDNNYDMGVKSGTEPILSISYDSPYEYSGNAALEQTSDFSPDAEDVTKETTKDSNVSAKRLEDRINLFDQELLDTFFKKVQKKIRSRIRYGQNPAALPVPDTKYNAGTLKTMKRDFIPRLGQYDSDSNHGGFGSNPYGQQLFRFPSLNTQRNNPDYNRHNFGTPVTSPDLINTVVDPNHDWPSSYSENPQQGLHGSQSGPGFTNSLPSESNSRAHTYKYLNSYYADSSTSTLGPFAGVFRGTY